MGPLAMALALVVAFGLFAWSMRQRLRLLRRGAAATCTDRPAERLRAVIKYAFGQARMPRYRGAGVAHILIFSGFLVLLLRSLMLWVRGFDADFSFGVLAADQPLGQVYSLVKDAFVTLVLAGAGYFIYLRVVRRPDRLTLSGEGLLILVIIVVMMLADVCYDGAALADPGAPQRSAWEPLGRLAAGAFTGLGVSPAGLEALRHVGFWTHSLLVLLFLNLLPYTKHFHILTAIPNVYLQNLAPPGRLAPLVDLEGKAERGETLGVARIEQFTWKGLLDLYTCTECGRCSDNCPATRTGKLLSPKHFTVDLRDHLYGRNAALPTGPAAERDDAADGGVVGPVVKPEVVWACTTCRACEVECPVFISYVDKMVDLRRYLVQEKGEFPGGLATAFRGLEQSGNPWNLPASQRAAWAEGLAVPRLADKGSAEWLLWVGCAAAYEEKAAKIARAMVQLLNHAGVDYAILGEEEQCNGDPARRAGNEFLFQTLAAANVELLNGYGVRKILTICPHCFNTLAHEYGDFGGHYQVVPHVEMLADLVAKGRLRPVRPVTARVVYHDSCYLGRYNGMYRSPRDVLAGIPGVQLIEAASSRDRGMCCGAGGAQFFKEEETGRERVNYARTDQLLATGAGLLAAACPFCKTMLSDGVAARDRTDNTQVLDVAEVLWQAVQG